MADWTPPSWAVRPIKPISLAIHKEGKQVGVCDVSRSSATIFGRNTEGVTCGAVTLDHDSISRRHAALVHDMQRRVHLIDLNSRHGTRINGTVMTPRKYYELLPGACIQFGASTRKYVLQTGQEAEAAPRLEAKPAKPASEPGTGEAGNIDLAALRRLGPAARATLTPAEVRALEMLSTLEDDEDPMRGYVDDPKAFGMPDAELSRAVERGPEHGGGERDAKRAKHKHRKREERPSKATKAKHDGKREHRRSHRSRASGPESAPAHELEAEEERVEKRRRHERKGHRRKKAKGDRGVGEPEKRKEGKPSGLSHEKEKAESGTEKGS